MFNSNTFNACLLGVKVVVLVATLPWADNLPDKTKADTATTEKDPTPAEVVASVPGL